MNILPTRRFVIGAAAVFALVVTAVWTWAVNGRMWFLDPEYPVWVARSQMIRDCAHGETTILGDSRPLSGLIPARMGDGVMNLALGGASPIETAYLVKALLKCPSRPKRVVVSFGPIVFMNAEYYWYRSALFDFLTFQQMEEVRLRSQQLGDTSVYHHAKSLHHLNDLLENYYHRINLPSYYFPAMLNAGFVTRREKNLRVLEENLRDRGYHQFGNAARADWVSPEANMQAFAAAPLLDHYFGRMLTVLRERDIPVYFVSAPINEVTGRKLRPAVRDQFTRYLDRLQQKHANFKILGPLLPVLPAEYFSDPDHLNSAGALAWSDLVTSQIALAATEGPEVWSKSN